MSHVVCFNCGKPGHYAKDCRSKKQGRSGSDCSSYSGSDSDKPKSERLCHFHKPLAKPPKKCDKGDKCEFTHGKEKPRKRGTPSVTHTTQNALFGWSILATALLGNILPTQSFQISENSDARGSLNGPEKIGPRGGTRDIILSR